MKRNVIGQYAAALFCAVLARFVGATCVATDNPSSACRYPAGDAWCVRNGGGNLYAYKDGCAEAQEPTESHMTTRPPPARVAWKPVAVWNCDQAKTVVEHLVCAAPDVHDQDVRMGALYAQLQARGLAPEQMQKAWLKKQREACNTVDCLRAVYAERIGQLEDLLAATPEKLTAAVSPALAVPPSTQTIAPATARPPTPANLDVEAVPAAAAQTVMPAVGPPTSVPESTIPQLPPPELRSPATTVPSAASPTSKGHGLAVWVFALALALGLFAWLSRSRPSGTQPAYVRLLAVVRGLGGQREPRARTTTLRLGVETRQRLNHLRRPGESEAQVVARAVTALEAAGSITSAGTVTTQRLDTLEMRLQRLEGPLTSGSHPDIKG